MNVNFIFIFDNIFLLILLLIHLIFLLLILKRIKKIKYNFLNLYNNNFISNFFLYKINSQYSNKSK